MKFLESLYSIPNFGIYLFVVIGILVVLFLVILFFGKKDEQKRKIEKEKEQEQTSFVSEQPVVSEPAFHETSTPVAFEVPVAPVVQDPIEPVSVISSENVSTFSEPVVEKEKDFDFDALAEAISKELESIENNEVQVPIKEEPKYSTPSAPILKKVEEPDLNYHVFEPISEPVKEEVRIEPSIPVEPVAPVTIKEPEVPKVEPEMPKVPRPAVFSSVYVNRDKEEPILSEAQKPVQEEIVKPVAPKIELPKMMDLPKMK